MLAMMRWMEGVVMHCDNVSEGVCSSPASQVCPCPVQNTHGIENQFTGNQCTTPVRDKGRSIG